MESDIFIKAQIYNMISLLSQGKQTPAKEAKIRELENRLKEIEERSRKI